MKIHFLTATALGLALLAGSTGPVRAQTNLLANPSFETGGFVDSGNGFETVNSGSYIFPWQVVGATVAWGTTPNSTGIVASAGTKFVNLAGFHDAPFGGVTQLAVLTSGLVYQLSFDLGSYQSDPQLVGPVSVHVTAGGISNVLDTNVTYAATGSGTQWGHFNLAFTAGASTTIKFLGTAGGRYIGLDNVSLTAAAQLLLNGGFELGSGLYTDTADTSQVTTAAIGWTQFNNGLRVAASDLIPSANNPAADPNAVFAAVGAHGGAYVLKCYGPSGDYWDASGAYQVVTKDVGAGQVWVLSGYGLNWSGDPMTNVTLSAQQFGLIQLVFQDAAGTPILNGSFDGPHLNPTNPVPVDTWISCSVTGTTPVGAAKLVAYAMHVGFGPGNQGSIFWDDLVLTNLTAYVQPAKSFDLNLVAGNQACWPTVAGLSYQPQYTNSATGPVWTNSGGEVAGDGNTNCVFDVGGQSKKNFYRVIEWQ